MLVIASIGTAVLTGFLVIAAFVAMKWQITCIQRAHRQRTQKLLAGDFQNLHRVTVTRHARWLMFGRNPEALYR